MVKKFIDFIITQKCTYACPYCSQSKAETKDKKDADLKTINSFLSLLNKIDKDFEITITGGEAMLHPEFCNLAEKIKNKGFKINLITNLSFEIEKYKKIFDLLDNSLNRFDISFHLDEIKDFDLTADKLKQILKIKPSATDTVFLIPIYKINTQKERKIEIIKQIANENNIKIDFQHIHFFEKYAENKENEKDYIKNMPQKTFSSLCFAGCHSAVIYENGEVYRCYSSRFLKSNHLGNINDKNFSLLSSPKPCVHNFCTCPKPKNYGQITNSKAPFKAITLKALNMLFFPYYILKNFDIVKAKIKQLKNQ